MGRRVRLIQMFGKSNVAWRNVIAAACYDQRWEYHEHWSGDAPAPSNDNMIIISPIETPDPAATDWVIMSTSPQEVVDAMADFGFAPAEAVFHASRLLALGSVMARSGAAVIDGSASSIDIPWLGSVHLDPSIVAPSPTARDDGLNLYRTLPPVPGEMHDIDLSLVDFPIYRETDTGGPVINLLGRPRSLFVTPMIHVPPGHWSVTLVFTVATSGPIRLQFLWGFGADTVKVQEAVTRPGRYQMSISREWREVGPASLTGVLVASLLDGELTLESVRLHSP